MSKSATNKIAAIAIICLVVGTGAGYFFGISSAPSAPGPGGPSVTTVTTESGALQAKITESKTLRIGTTLSAWALSFDPAMNYAQDPEQGIARAIYDTLIQMNGNSYGVFYPNLATHYEVSSDGLQYTFYMRQGVKFVSGNPVTAKAAEYSYWRLMKLNLAPAWLFTQCLDPDNPDSVKAVDDYTLQFNLKKPFPPFLAILSQMNGGVMDPADVDAHGGVSQTSVDYYSEHSGQANSGPYILDHWTRGVELVLKKNPNYWGGPDHKQPWFDTIIYKIVKEPADQKMLLERGDIDIAYNLTPDMWTELMDNPDITVDQIRKDIYFYMVMSVAKADSPFRNLKVRQAVKQALNRDELIQLAQGYASPVASPLVSNYLGWDPSLLTSPYSSYNPENSKKLLQEAGYPNGFKTSILIADTTDTGIQYRDLAALVKQQLATVGIDAEINAYASATAGKMFRAAQFDGLAIFSWAVDYVDSQNNADINWRMDGAIVHRSGGTTPDDFTGENYASMDGGSFIRETTTLCDQAVATTDAATRDALYKQAGKLDDQYGAIYYFFQPFGYYASRSYVRGQYPPNPGDRLSALYGYELKNMWKDIDMM
jgi:peptide/nickel transport system substrate-binding protein